MSIYNKKFFNRILPKDLRFLLVEDNFLIRKHHLKEIRKYGYAESAETAEVAKKKILEDHWDIIFMDLNLSEKIRLEGLELIKDASKRGFYIVVTSNQDEEKMRCFENGAHEFRGKFAIKTIEDIIRNYVEFSSRSG